MNKRTLLLLIISLLFSASYGQNILKKLEEKHQKVELLEEDGYKRYRVQSNGKWGLLDVKGNTILPCNFDWLYIGSTYSTENKTFYIAAKRDGKMGLYDMKGKELFPFIYEFASLNYEESSKTFYVGVKNNDKYKKSVFSAK